ncbi:MAG: hypothetical protein WAT41_14955, partial [Flavobacteriales bacterium]
MIITAVLFSTTVNAQFWKAMGKGSLSPYEIQRLFADTVENRLLGSGTFDLIINDDDTVEAHGQAVWNGTRWDSLAHRVVPGHGQTYWFLRYQGALYSCGANGFFTPEGDVNYSFARLNEQTEYWEALECLNSPWNGLSQLVPRFANPVLYATGYPGTLCDQDITNVYVYDGLGFIPWAPFGQVEYDSDNYIGSVFDYRGKTYVSGDFRDPLGPGYATFMRWTGAEWEYVPGWNNSGILKDFLVHNDTLYVTGSFRTVSGAPGNLVASFDGESWNSLGEGLAYFPNGSTGSGFDLEWYHGALLVAGQFNRAGGVEVDRIAKWDGVRWCGFPGDFQGSSFLYDMAVWRDTLYICGGFNTIDGEPIRQVAQWIGGDAVGECSTVGIAEQAAARPLSIVPLADAGQWEVRYPFPGNWTLTAYDATGRQISTWTTKSGGQAID